MSIRIMEGDFSISAILFDLIGTIIMGTSASEILNTEEGYYEIQVKAIYDSLKKDGVSVDWHQFKSHYEKVRIDQKEQSKKTLREYDMCQRVSDTLSYFSYDMPSSSDIIRKAVDAYMDLYLDTLQVEKSTHRVLEKLTDKFKLGVVTNFAYFPGAYRATEKFALRPYFEAIIVSGKVGWKKPSKRIFNIALSKLSVKSEEAIFVGDDYEGDIFGAKKVGMKTIFLCKEPTNNEGVDIIIGSLPELPSAIERLT